MQTIYTARHFDQRGRAELINGQLLPCFEKPERAEIILRRLEQAALGPVIKPGDHGHDAILAVHSGDYVEFLRTVWDRWSAVRGDIDALPLNWIAPNMRRIRPENLDGQLSYHSFDAGTPITPGTWSAAYWAAQCAISGAQLLQAGETSAFALCRPPGHHAGRDFYGGYCFLNNAAIAAGWLRAQGAARIAILDVDYHHGNGTQEIFWDRDDVLVASLHADPRHEYPFFSGFADEIGVGAGEGCNINRPLPIGTDWPAYADALADVLAHIDRFGPDAVIVSLGADTFAEDPISRFRLVTRDFPRLGSAIAALDRPTLFVMEGGYAVEALGTNVLGVLQGFLQA